MTKLKTAKGSDKNSTIKNQKHSKKSTDNISIGELLDGIRYRIQRALEEKAEKGGRHKR